MRMHTSLTRSFRIMPPPPPDDSPAAGWPRCGRSSQCSRAFSAGSRCRPPHDSPRRWSQSPRRVEQRLLRDVAALRLQDAHDVNRAMAHAIAASQHPGSKVEGRVAERRLSTSRPPAAARGAASSSRESNGMSNTITALAFSPATASMIDFAVSISGWGNAWCSARRRFMTV